MRTIRAFFPKSEHFFQFSKKGKVRPPPSPFLRACLPCNKGKKEEKRYWKCLPKRNWNSPCDVQGKAFFKKNWSEISQLFMFFFSTLYKWNPSQIFVKDFCYISSWNIGMWKIRLTTDLSSNKQIEKTIFLVIWKKFRM